MAFKFIPLDIFKVTKHLQRNCILGKESQYFCSVIMSHRNFFREAVTRNLELISKDKVELDKQAGKVPILKNKSNRPLAVLFEWISADKKHFYKYSDLYLERGYDVLAVSLSVWQLLWPTTGSQTIAVEALDFLYQNPNYNPLLVHGFSIGGYVWGEVLVLIKKDLPKYQHIVNRIKGQIWDSTPDVTEIHKGFPAAVFPNNALLRLAVEKSIAYHLRIFHDTATKHYITASQHFHNTPVKAPVLFYIAKNDPVASYNSVLKVKDYWTSQGMKTYLKSWEKSKHVSHLRLHKDDYIKTLDTFLACLDETGSLQKSEKIQAKL